MAGNEGYEGIRFSYSSMGLDVRRMKQLARRFLDRDSGAVLDQCAMDLESARNASALRLHRWEIPRERPVRTRSSRGEYRDSDKGTGEQVFGELYFTWQLRNPDKGKARQHFFYLVERASTRILVRAVEDKRIVAHWQFEAGDTASPGCHFHSSVNQDRSEGVFPAWLKIPRLPGLLLTPMDALEFLLGELFQREWHREVSAASEARDAWSKSQKARLVALLKWQLETVEGWTTTPWMHLKKAKPQLDIFEAP